MMREDDPPAPAPAPKPMAGDPVVTPLAAVSVTVKWYGGLPLVTPATVLLSTPLWGTNYYGGLPSADTLTLAGA